MGCPKRSSDVCALSKCADSASCALSKCADFPSCALNKCAGSSSCALSKCAGPALCALSKCARPDELLEEDEIPQLRIHKNHPTENIIGPLNVGVHTRSACDALDNSMFSCFISQVEPKNIKAALLGWKQCKKSCNNSQN
ncbi:hypothetical protein L1987_37321 [Smallanthus sonchifolius]|uniref:Uncharacterized protein n=1 Tax=Smallanthus sonchifolius TaxID=185202 RepID=A0ACB9HHA5_9ASTR|nr:hypothetical protein L1987_37321 [Smallanthus sonchifolius]